MKLKSDVHTPIDRNELNEWIQFIHTMNELENTFEFYMEYYSGTFQRHHLIFTDCWPKSHNRCYLVKNIFLVIG